MLGLGPPDVREGDKIYALAGPTHPYILRPATGADGACCTMLGECYVLDMMHGEGLLGGDWDDLRKRIIPRSRLTSDEEARAPFSSPGELPQENAELLKADWEDLTLV